MYVYCCPCICSCRYWNDELQRHKKGQTPRLWFAIMRCLKWRLLIQGIIFCVLVSNIYGACALAMFSWGATKFTLKFIIYCAMQKVLKYFAK